MTSEWGRVAQTQVTASASVSVFPSQVRCYLCGIFMDILKQLFEQHFHTPADAGAAAAGTARRLGPEDHPADRRRVQRDWHSVRRARRERRLPRIFPAFPAAWSAGAGNLCRRFELRAPISKKTWATRRFSSFSRRIATGDNIAPRGGRGLSQSRRRVAPLSGRSRARFELQGVLSARQLRSPVHLPGT